MWLKAPPGGVRGKNDLLQVTGHKTVDLKSFLHPLNKIGSTQHGQL
jgi:hypothetical protein